MSEEREAGAEVAAFEREARRAERGSAGPIAELSCFMRRPRKRWMAPLISALF